MKTTRLEETKSEETSYRIKEKKKSGVERSE